MKNNIITFIALSIVLFAVSCTYRKNNINTNQDTATDSYYISTTKAIITQNCSCHTTGQNPDLSSFSSIVTNAQGVYNSIQKPNGSMVARSNISDANIKILSDWLVYYINAKAIVTQNCSCHTEGQNPDLSSFSLLQANAQSVHRVIQKPNGSMLNRGTNPISNNENSRVLLSDWLNAIQ